MGKVACCIFIIIFLVFIIVSTGLVFNVFYNSELMHIVYYNDGSSVYYDIGVYGNGTVSYVIGKQFIFSPEDAKERLKQYKVDVATGNLYTKKGSNKIDFADQCIIWGKLIQLQFMPKMSEPQVSGMVDRAEVTVLGRTQQIIAQEREIAYETTLNEIIDILRDYCELPQEPLSIYY